MRLQNLPEELSLEWRGGHTCLARFARLTPRFEVGGQTYAMATHRLAALPLSEIGPSIADLSTRADEIIGATDFLFQGF